MFDTYDDIGPSDDKENGIGDILEVMAKLSLSQTAVTRGSDAIFYDEFITHICGKGQRHPVAVGYDIRCAMKQMVVHA